MKRIFAALIASSLLTAPAALAGELADAAAKADELVATGNFVEAMQALEAAQDKLWVASPLMFRRALFTAGQPVGYGIYDLREGSTFKRSEPLITYSEPMGYGYGRDGSLFVISIDLDFVIKDGQGNEVARQENFGNLNFRSRFPNKEFMAKVDYDFSGLQAGGYTVTTVFKDKNSAKTAEFTLAFTLVD